jgi:hypothetical protein
VDIPAGFVESCRVLEDKRLRLAYFHDDANLYLLGLPPGGSRFIEVRIRSNPGSRKISPATSRGKSR